MAFSARTAPPALPGPDREAAPADHDAHHGPNAGTSRTGPLWLAAHFPWLAGEVFREKEAGGQWIVFESSRRGSAVYQACPETRRRGVVPGMTLSAASVVCPGVPVKRRRPGLEKRRLAAIGERMRRFSPVISLDSPATVLLEVRGSLTLFRGLERLRALIDRELQATGHIYRLAGAPAPAAAGCLARWGRTRVVTDSSALRSVLGAMPAALLDLDGKTVGRLKRAGIQTLRDLWRLPTDGLARRFGTSLVRELDRLQGRRPDPRPLHESPLYYSAALMLDWATDDLAQIEQGVGHLLEQWADELRRAVRGTSGFTIECLPEQGDNPLRVDVGLRRISRDKAHLCRLAGERLSRGRLHGPVTGLVLTSDRLHPLAGHNGRLFDDPGEHGDEAAAQWQLSEELLAMRLGGQGLHTLRAIAEHRPEYAWRAIPPDPSCRDEPGVAGAHRPLWLLEPPRPLPWPRQASRRRNRPTIVRGPERIETGWWDRRDQRRDYYAATDGQGRRMWVFWDLKHQRWYLHGLFA